jgi:hypothetical protein
LPLRGLTHSKRRHDDVIFFAFAEQEEFARKQIACGHECAVLSPVDKKYDRVIGQWTDNGISPLDAEKARLVYGTNTP